MYFCLVEHEKYMARCLQLAGGGLGLTYPNPLVGSVVVHKDTIIGEGWHRKSGEAHAEVNAVNSVRDASLLPDSTLYVNLEPCSHFGKTPPCADMIIRHGIKNVVVGSPDPNELVAGRGIERLRSAGVNVTVGVLEREALELNRRFFTFQNKRRPYVILKWAESADGFMAPKIRSDRNPVWLSNRYSRQLVHKWRSEEAAILVGTQTALDDNPSLDVRDWTGNNPVRLVADRTGCIPVSSRIFSGGKTIMVSEQIHDRGESVICESAPTHEFVPRMLDVMYRHGLLSVIVEGGRMTLQSFIDAGVYDEVRVFKSAVYLGEGIEAPKLKLQPESEKYIGGDKLQIFRND